jgi:hypothetical protein
MRNRYRQVLLSSQQSATVGNASTVLGRAPMPMPDPGKNWIGGEQMVRNATKLGRSDTGSFVRFEVTGGAHLDSSDQGTAGANLEGKRQPEGTPLVCKLRHYPSCQHLQNRHARGG